MYPLYVSMKKNKRSSTYLITLNGALNDTSSISYSRCGKSGTEIQCANPSDSDSMTANAANLKKREHEYYLMVTF